MPDLDTLEAYLASDEAHPDRMGISDLDGFLTGVACSPEPIPLEEWLNVALGDAMETPGTIWKIVRQMYQEIRELLDNGQPIEPLFWERPDGTVIAMDWCEGFMDAVKLRPERWDVFAGTDTGARLMLPILVHMIDDDGNSAMGIAREDLDETLDAAAEAIPTAVPAIYRRIRVVKQN